MTTATAPVQKRIDRLFSDIPDDALEGVLDSYEAHYFGVGWPELLRSKRVLIVAEAGVGKTYECQTEAKHLWEAGEAAFFLELSELARGGLEHALIIGSPEHQRFLCWLKSENETATFFLDSLDELKLLRQDFARALRTLSAGIQGHLRRVRIVITTRPTSIDVAAVRSLLPVPEKDVQPSAEAFANLAMGRQKSALSEKDPPEWRQVRLLTLSDSQIREFAAEQGVDDVDAFMSDIEDRNAEEFARRPQDLIELCADWRAHRRIRLHAQQVDNAIAIKLSSKSPRPELVPLADTMAREGAARLALAALLARKFRFRLPGNAAGHDFSGAIDTAEILPDWSDEQRETLLQRPLFGYASYHEVRFQHRSIIEYLAAERLSEYFGNQLSRRAVRRLLFGTTAQGTRIVKPTMRGAAAWMALKHQDIFSGILACDPSVLLTEGDPQSLSSPQRVDALKAFVARFGPGNWRALRVPWSQVRRFAHADLAQAINEVWPGAENPDVRTVLLNLIEAATLVNCADIAYQASSDQARDDHERLDALDALVAIGDPRYGTLIQDAVEHLEQWPDSLVRGIIARHFPKPLGPRELDQLLRRLACVEDDSDHLRSLADQIRASNFEQGELDELLSNLLSQINAGLRWSTESMQPVSNRAELIPALLATCELVWARRGPSGEVIKAAVIGSRLTRHNDLEHEGERVRSLLEDLNSADRATAVSEHDAFVSGIAGESRSAHSRHMDLLAYGPFEFDSDRDLEWNIQTASHAGRSEVDRELYLTIAMWLGNRTEKYDDVLARLRAAVSNSPVLLAVVAQERRPSVPDPEIERLEHERLQRQEERRQRDSSAHGSWVKFWNELASASETVLVDKSTESTSFDLWRVMSKVDARDRLAGWNREYLERNFGEPTTENIRAAMKHAWRLRTPTLRSERPVDQRNTGDLRWQMGLAGIYAEAEDPDWAQKLTTQEARLAARYAPLALSGLPAWLDDLAAAFPNEVDEVVGAELTFDLAENSPNEIYPMLVQSVRYATADVRELFAPRLVHWLQGPQVPDFDHQQSVARMHHVISVLLGSDNEVARTSVEAFLRKHLGDDADAAALKALLPVEMQLDPEAGIAHLENIASTCMPSQKSLIVELLGTFLGDRFGRQTFHLAPDQLSISQLMRLLRLTYAHVRKEDDVKHKDAYSPGVRDNAQDARRDLLKVLLGAEGTDAWSAKLELARDPQFVDLQDYIRAEAQGTSAQEADQATLSEQDIYQLEKRREAPPTNRDDMFALMKDRIDDLEDLLVQDTSLRGVWALIQQERDMRVAISNELRHRANGAYLIDQESITADDKETDIRLRSLIPNEEGVIELKVGDKNWSIADYRAALSHQLVAQYLAPEHRRAGCLLITLANTREWIDANSGQRLGFQQLVELLSQDAAKLVNQMGGTIRLSVRGLDLRAATEEGRPARRRGSKAPL